MIIVQINATATTGSIGKICRAVSERLNAKGVENYILHTQEGCDYPQGICYAGKNYLKIQALKSRVFGNYGFNSVLATRRLIAELDRIGPTIVHLHNLHGHNCHLGMLLNYLREKKIKVFWTFHDCWNFTGYCPHFDMVGCDQWLTQCRHCVRRREFTWFFDRSRLLYRRKKALSSSLDLTIVAPSRWTAEVTRQSFFGEYPIEVIHNGISLETFKPTESSFREKHGIGDRKLVLGVAAAWMARKGLDVFLELAKRLDDSYRIVLVGTDDQVDKLLPKGVISIHHTANVAELAEIYTAADVYANPTREEVLGLVNLEALACGTPVITFNSGGSPECVDETCGVVVPKNDVDAMEAAIRYVTTERPFSPEACRAYASHFDADSKFGEYIKLYGL